MVNAVNIRHKVQNCITCKSLKNNVNVKSGVGQEIAEDGEVNEADQRGQENGNVLWHRQNCVDNNDVEENVRSVLDGAHITTAVYEWNQVVQCDQSRYEGTDQNWILLEFGLVAYQVQHQHYGREADHKECG